MLTGQRLAQFSFLPFPEEKLNMLASLMEIEEFKDKDVILSEENQTFSLYLILKGKVQIYKANSGFLSILSILEQNDLFGEVAFVDHKCRSACAAAIGKVTVAVFKADHFDIIKKQDPSLGMDFLFHLMRELTRKFRAVNEGLDIKSPEHTIQELITSGNQIMLTTKTGLDYYCTIKAADRTNQQIPFLKIEVKDQILLIPFHEIKAIVFPNKYGKF